MPRNKSFLSPLSPALHRLPADMSGMRVVLKDLAGAPKVIVNHVYPNTPAQEAGIQQGDRLLDIDGRSVDSFPLPRHSGSIDWHALSPKEAKDSAWKHGSYGSNPSSSSNLSA